MTIDDYVELLAAEGYRPVLSESGSEITFKHDGEVFTLENDVEDATYVRLRSVFRLRDEAGELQALRSANGANELLKGVKTVVDIEGSAVIFSIEAFYAEAALLAPHLARALGALDSASDRFFETLEPGEDVSEDSATL